MVEDFKDRHGEWATCKTVNGTKHLTRSYSVWNAMRYRCRPGGLFQKKFPSYVGCSMSPLFADFQTFTDWHMRQVGYGIEGYALDKDIINKSAKLYSEGTCVLIPSDLNSFYTPNTNRKAALPAGVYAVKNRYRAAISIDNKLQYIGYYDTVDAASEAFKAAKRQEALRWAGRLEAGEYIVDGRVIQALRKFNID